MGANPDNVHTTAIVPVKGLSVANGRLDGTLSQEERNSLAEALFLDLIVKLPRSRSIDDVMVVTADKSIARQARWFGHKTLLQDADEGHSEAAIAGAGAAMSEGAQRVAMLPVDCPMLDTEELDDASERYSEQVSEAVSSDDETAAYVAELEQRAEELDAEEDLPSGETLAAELTRFLRDRERGNGGPERGPSEQP